MTMCLRDPCYCYSKLHSVFNVVSKIVINMLKACKVRLMGEGWKWCKQNVEEKVRPQAEPGWFRHLSKNLIFPCFNYQCLFSSLDFLNFIFIYLLIAIGNNCTLLSKRFRITTSYTVLIQNSYKKSCIHNTKASMMKTTRTINYYYEILQLGLHLKN